MNENDISTWVEDENGWHFCEKCGYDANCRYNILAQHYYEHLSKFCPHCGRNMTNGES